MARLMVFEDEPNIRRLLSVLFEGYDVVFRPDGGDALEHIAAERPDVVVLDLKLPKMGGVEILEQLQAHPELRHTAVIVISGSVELLGNPVVSACTSLLQKPFDIFALKALVDRQLNARLAAKVTG